MGRKGGVTMATNEYQLSGLACQHCVTAVTKSVLSIPGVDAVDIELGSQRMTITTSQEILFDLISAAVLDAGDGVYTVQAV